MTPFLGVIWDYMMWQRYPSHLHDEALLLPSLLKNRSLEEIFLGVFS